MKKKFGKKVYGEPESVSFDEEEETTGPDLLMFGVIGLAVLAAGLFGYKMLNSNSVKDVSSASAKARPVGDRTNVHSAVAQNSFPELDKYLSPSLGITWKSKQAKFERTTQLLEQCGGSFVDVRTEYTSRNQQAYQTMKVQQLNSRPQSTQDLADVSGLRMTTSITRDNSNMAMLSNGRDAMIANDEQAFKRQLNDAECQYLAQRVKGGFQNL